MSSKDSQTLNSRLGGREPLQWLGEPAVAVNDHFDPEELKAIQLKIKDTTGLQPCEGEPNDWNDVAPC